MADTRTITVEQLVKMDGMPSNVLV